VLTMLPMRPTRYHPLPTARMLAPMKEPPAPAPVLVLVPLDRSKVAATHCVAWLKTQSVSIERSAALAKTLPPNGTPAATAPPAAL
jgi:hypothetical protein